MDIEMLKKYFIYDESSPTCLIKSMAWQTKKLMPAGVLNHNGVNQYVVALPKSECKTKGFIVLAKVVYAITIGPIPEGYTVIHIDGNRLNCKKNNLKLATHGEACADKRRRTSAYEDGIRIDNYGGKSSWTGSHKLYNGEIARKSFSITKYGYTAAKQMARAFRDGSFTANILLS